MLSAESYRSVSLIGRSLIMISQNSFRLLKEICPKIPIKLTSSRLILGSQHVGDGISVDPPLRRGSALIFGSSSRRPNYEGEGGRKIGEVGERECDDKLFLTYQCAILGCAPLSHACSRGK